MGHRPWNDDDDDNRPEPPDLQRFYHQLNQPSPPGSSRVHPNRN
jgi:hypothetical protein